MVLQIKAGQLVGFLITLLMGIGGTGFSFWQDTNATLQKNTLEIEYTKELLTQRLDRIDKILDRMENFNQNQTQNQNPNQNHPHHEN